MTESRNHRMTDRLKTVYPPKTTFCGGYKNNLRIISKPHAYLQTMSKTPVKFKKNRHKTIGGVEHTRYPLSIHFDSKNA